MTLAYGLVLLASAAAAYTDLRTRRIPNVIPGALALGGLLLAVRDGWSAAAAFAAILCALLLFGTPLFAWRLLGGGDVKMIAAASATLGLAEMRVFLIATILCGGVLGIAVAASHGRLRATMANVRTMALPMLSGGTLVPLAGDLKMPYGVAIFAGALVAAALHFAGLLK